MGLIFVIDDDEGVRTSLCELLEDEGHQATGFPNGRRAFDELLAGAHPCVIFLDLMMPVMDGWTFRAEQLKDTRLSRIPVVVITAAGERMAASVNASEVLQKPLKAERVLALVGEYC
jgi:CheY-like chemotaxis protein